MRACPYCAEEIQDAAILCKHCGRDLIPDEIEAVAGRWATLGEGKREAIWGGLSGAERELLKKALAARPAADVVAGDSDWDVYARTFATLSPEDQNQRRLTLSDEQRQALDAALAKLNLSGRHGLPKPLIWIIVTLVILFFLWDAMQGF